jgi:hypothetical protein
MLNDVITKQIRLLASIRQSQSMLERSLFIISAILSCYFYMRKNKRTLTISCSTSSDIAADYFAFAFAFDIVKFRWLNMVI